MKFREFVRNQIKIRNFKDLCIVFLKLAVIYFIFIEVYDDLLYLMCIMENVKSKINSRVIPAIPLFFYFIKRAIIFGLILIPIYRVLKHIKKKGAVSVFESKVTFRKAVKFLIVLSVITYWINGSILFVFFWDGPYWGRVVDADTGKPIAGASVAGEWMFDYVIPPFPAGGEEFADARETVTGKSGYFYVPMARTAWFWPFSRIVLDDLYVYKPGYDSHPPRMDNVWSEDDKRKWLAKLTKQYPEIRKKYSKEYHSIKPKEYFSDTRYAPSIYGRIFRADCKFYKPCIIKLNKALSIKEQREAASISFSADNGFEGYKIKKIIELLRLANKDLNNFKKDKYQSTR